MDDRRVGQLLFVKANTVEYVADPCLATVSSDVREENHKHKKSTFMKLGGDSVLRRLQRDAPRCGSETTSE